MEHSQDCMMWQVNNSANNGSGFPEPEDVACTCGASEAAQPGVQADGGDAEAKSEDFAKVLKMVGNDDFKKPRR